MARTALEAHARSPGIKIGARAGLLRGIDTGFVASAASARSGWARRGRRARSAPALTSASMVSPRQLPIIALLDFDEVRGLIGRLRSQARHLHCRLPHQRAAGRRPGLTERPLVWSVTLGNARLRLRARRSPGSSGWPGVFGGAQPQRRSACAVTPASNTARSGVRALRRSANADREHRIGQPRAPVPGETALWRRGGRGAGGRQVRWRSAGKLAASAIDAR